MRDLRVRAPRSARIAKRTAPDCRDGPLAVRYSDLHVVVELELVGVRTEAQLVNLSGALVVDPRLDEVLGEHAALGEERVVRLEVVEHLGKRSRHLRDEGVLLRGELVEV